MSFVTAGGGTGAILAEQALLIFLIFRVAASSVLTSAWALEQVQLFYI